MRPILTVLWFVFLALPHSFASTNAWTNAPMRIAAAADLQPLLPQVLAEFERQTGVRADAVYASSATLTMQILNGAPYDLFLAADMAFPAKVIAEGKGASGKPVPYARGTLVLWTRNDSPLRHLTLGSLREPALEKVAVADPDHAPYGRAAKQAIANLNLSGNLKAKLVVAENIAQAAQFVYSGNAEAGLISLTSARTPQLERAGHFIEIPPGSYAPILQGAVVIKHSQFSGQANRFLEFLNSPAIRQQLRSRGLEAP